MSVTDTYDDDDLVSVATAARLLGVHAETVRRYEARGLIQAQRTPTNHRRFRVGDLRALITSEEPAA